MTYDQLQIYRNPLKISWLTNSSELRLPLNPYTNVLKYLYNYTALRDSYYKTISQVFSQLHSHKYSKRFNFSYVTFALDSA